MMRKSLTAAVLAAAALVAAGPAASAEEAPATEESTTPATQLERVSAYTQPSIVYLGITWSGYVYDRYNKMYLNNSQPFELSFQCTGYVVNPDGYIATAGHCVDPAEARAAFIQNAAQWALDNGYYQATDLTLEQVIGFDDYVVQNAEGKRGAERTVTAAWSQSAGGVETGKALPARVVKWQKFEQGDGAMLKVEAENLNALPLAEDDIEIGTEIVAVGYPGSVDLVADQTFTPSYKDGSVSSTKTVSNGLLTVYEISAAVSGGMSGGPTVNLDGEVVGFNSFGINSQIETQQFNFVRPVDTVRELLGDAGAQAELGEDAQSYREGLDAFFAGDKETAVEKLGAVVDSQPTHELAKEYLDKAEALPDPPAEPKDEGSNLGLVLGIAGGVAVLALAGVGLLVALTRRKKGGAPAPVQQYAAPPAPPGTQGPAQAAFPAPVQAQPPVPVPAPPAGFGPTPQTVPTVPAQAAPERQESTVMTASAPQAAATAPAATVGPAEASAQVGPAPAPVVVEDDTLFCTSCGTKGQPAQKFCGHCGSPL
jgi:S1-C subfamily serine protease